MYGQELEMARATNFEGEQRLNHTTSQMIGLQRTEQDLRVKLEEMTAAVRQ
jgi:hypothetical protein